MVLDQLKIKYLNSDGFLVSLGDIARKLGEVDVETIIKELGQNSLDAVLDPKKPVKLEVKLVKIPANIQNNMLKQIGFSDIERIINNLKLMMNYDKNERERYEKMLLILEKPSDTFFLVVSDYNTYGLTGNDEFSLKSESRFQGFNYRLGLSEKSSDLGSYGEGRLAPLSTSSLQYVYEVSHLAEKWKNKKFRKFGLGFHGVFEDSETRVYSGVFFSCIENNKGQTISLMTNNIDKECFIIPQKRKEETGTTLIFPCVDVKSLLNITEEEMEEEKYAIEFLEQARKYAEHNFFPSIANRKLEIDFIYSEIEENNEIKKYGDTLNKDALEETLCFLSNINSSTERRMKTDIKYINQVIIESVTLEVPQGRGLQRIEEKLPLKLIEINYDLLSEQKKAFLEPFINRVIFARNGMVIEAKDPKVHLRNYFIGLLDVRKEIHEEAHNFLRASEPVKHDKWKPTSNRLKNKYGVSAAPRCLNALFRNISNIVKKQFGYDSKKTTEVPKEIREEILEGLGINELTVSTERKEISAEIKSSHNTFKTTTKKRKSITIGKGFEVIAETSKNEAKIKINNNQEEKERIIKPKVLKKRASTVIKHGNKEKQLKRISDDNFKFYLVPKLIERTDSYILSNIDLPESTNYVKNLSVNSLVTSFDKPVNISLPYSITDSRDKTIISGEKIEKNQFPLKLKIDLTVLPERIREVVWVEISVMGEK